MKILSILIQLSIAVIYLVVLNQLGLYSDEDKRDLVVGAIGAGIVIIPGFLIEILFEYYKQD